MLKIGTNESNFSGNHQLLDHRCAAEPRQTSAAAAQLQRRSAGWGVQDEALCVVSQTAATHCDSQMSEAINPLVNQSGSHIPRWDADTYTHREIFIFSDSMTFLV